MNVSTNAITPDYFETIGLRFVAGRNFSPSEFLPSSSQRSGLRPVVVNQAFVDRFFPGSTGVGEKFGFGVDVIAKPERKIIGVVTNAKYRSLREPWQPTIYGPYALDSPGPAMLLVRTSGPASAVIQPVRGLLRQIVPTVPIYEVSTLKEDAEASVATEKLLAGLGSVFSAIATIIVAAGLFAALSFMVARRTREIAIRMAVGADGTDIVRLVSGQMSMLAGAGVACGIALSQAAGRFIGSLLYEVAPADAASIGGAALVMIAVAITSTMPPIIRAIRIQLASALRDE